MTTPTLAQILQDPSTALERYDGFIFDCDGTLADSMPVHYRAWCAAFAEIVPGLLFAEDFFYSLGGMPTREVAETVLRSAGRMANVDEITETKEKHYVRLIPEVQPVEPVTAFARHARQRGKPVAVATGTMPNVIGHSLAAIGMTDVFSIVITPAHVAQGKPAPDMFLLAAERMGTRPELTLVFEDGPPGFAAATAAGMAYVVVEANHYRR